MDHRRSPDCFGYVRVVTRTRVDVHMVCKLATDILADILEVQVGHRNRPAVACRDFFEFRDPSSVFRKLIAGISNDPFFHELCQKVIKGLKGEHAIDHKIAVLKKETAILAGSDRYVFFNRCGNKYLRMSSIVLGLCLGYVLAFVLGKVDMSSLNAGMLTSLNAPIPFKYGIDFNISSFIAVGLVYLITAIEATGDVTANSMISGLPIEGNSYLKRVSGGVLADGFNSFLAGVFNSFPNSIFAQNNGIIQLTGVASRYVGYYIAVMLVLLGLFPIVGAIFSLMPDPVLGGATLLMFGTVAAAGIRIVASQEIGRKETLVLAVSLSLGLGVELMPDVLKQAPEAIRSIFSSGITTGGLAAIIANVVIHVKDAE